MPFPGDAGSCWKANTWVAGSWLSTVWGTAKAYVQALISKVGIGISTGLGR